MSINYQQTLSTETNSFHPNKMEIQNSEYARSPHSRSLSQSQGRFGQTTETVPLTSTVDARSDSTLVRPQKIDHTTSAYQHHISIDNSQASFNDRSRIKSGSSVRTNHIPIKMEGRNSRKSSGQTSPVQKTAETQKKDQTNEQGPLRHKFQRLLYNNKYLITPKSWNIIPSTFIDIYFYSHTIQLLFYLILLTFTLYMMFFNHDWSNIYGKDFWQFKYMQFSAVGYSAVFVSLSSVALLNFVKKLKSKKSSCPNRPNPEENLEIYDSSRSSDDIGITHQPITEHQALKNKSHDPKSNLRLEKFILFTTSILQILTWLALFFHSWYYEANHTGMEIKFQKFWRTEFNNFISYTYPVYGYEIVGSENYYAGIETFSAIEKQEYRQINYLQEELTCCGFMTSQEYTRAATKILADLGEDFMQENMRFQKPVSCQLAINNSLQIQEENNWPTIGCYNPLREVFLNYRNMFLVIIGGSVVLSFVTMISAVVVLLYSCKMYSCCG